MIIYDLKTNDQDNPLGIDLEKVCFSWKVKEARGNFQKLIRVLIAEDARWKKLCYDSGYIPWETCLFAPETELHPGLRYYWKISVVDDSGESADSPIASFEGGHPEEEWSGRWIEAPFTAELHPVFCKEFEYDQDISEIQEARLYICGLGLYEARINGEKVGNQYLTPYFTDYRYRVQYQTFDVKGLLRNGKNRIEVYLGNGWYKGKFGYLNKGELRDYYGKKFSLIADLYIWNSDRREIVFGTNESWLALKSPVITSGIYDGEMYDARLEKEVSDPPERKCLRAVTAEKMPAKLVPMQGIPVVRKDTLKVKRVIITDIGETVLDFGQEITGWVSFTADVPSGQKIILQYGELLQDGVFYRDNLRTAKAEYVYISDGVRRVVRPHFTYYGFRYVKVSGMKVDESNVHEFEGWVLYSDMEEAGFPETSNEKVNRLIENTKWSQKDNFLDIPTDCPQRDERLGWTGDAQIFSAAACFHMMPAPFYRKYLQDMYCEQLEKNGAVPYVVPDVLTLARQKNAEPEFDMAADEWGEAGASVWGDAATIIPWNLYLFYGNREMLREQYANMKHWIDFVVGMDEEHCEGRRLWECGFHFGDWLALDGGETDNRGGTDRYLIASLFYMHSAQLTAKAAAILGEKEDAARYAKIAKEVRTAVRAKYLTGSGRFRTETQTAYALGICLKIFDRAEEKQAALRLQQLLQQNGGRLCTGFVGTAYLCPALTEAGLVKEAYDLLLNEAYPGWLYEVNLGATTIWERWNSLLPDGKVSDTGMNSLNHYAYGVIVEWIYRYVCGLQPMEEGPGFQKICFAPHSDPRLKYAMARYESVYGTYRAGWQYREEGIVYILEIPFNCEARIDLGADNLQIQAKGKEFVLLKEDWLTCGSYEIRLPEQNG